MQKLLFSLLIVSFACTAGMSQLYFSKESGGFGPYVGVVRSHLMAPSGNNTGFVQQGYEAGLKAELYRTEWLRGNVMFGWMQHGAQERFIAENAEGLATINLQSMKLNLMPVMLKWGGDKLHAYIGGGAYGAFMIKQDVDAPGLSGNYWQEGNELASTDYGIDISAGIHVWQFDIEFKLQRGLLDLGTRLDGSTVRNRTAGIHLAFLWVNNHTEVKSCRDKRK